MIPTFLLESIHYNLKRRKIRLSKLRAISRALGYRKVKGVISESTFNWYGIVTYHDYDGLELVLGDDVINHLDDQSKLVENKIENILKPLTSFSQANTKLRNEGFRMNNELSFEYDDFTQYVYQKDFTIEVEDLKLGDRVLTFYVDVAVYVNNEGDLYYEG